MAPVRPRSPPAIAIATWHQKRSNLQHLRKVAAQLERARKDLPIWAKCADIRWALRHNDVLLLNGETGSGKSTQVPQFLYTEPWCEKQMVKIKTQNTQEEVIPHWRNDRNHTASSSCCNKPWLIAWLVKWALRWSRGLVAKLDYSVSV